MKIIGITGGTGGGKTSALGALESLGALVVDCDDVYHELLIKSKEMLRDLESRFDGVVKDGVLDRRALGKIVFNDKNALKELNVITHRFVKEEVSRLLNAWEADGGTLAAIDAIALIESGLDKICDFIVGVTAPFEVRVRRIMQRDGINEEYARLRIAAQKPDRFYYDNCDFVLVSDFDTVDEFKDYCKTFFMRILGGTTNA